jgi:hypothetical protein
LQFQFETLANKLQYEREYLGLKSTKVERKLENEIIPSVERKKKLRDVLEALYEG